MKLRGTKKNCAIFWVTLYSKLHNNCKRSLVGTTWLSYSHRASL